MAWGANFLEKNEDGGVEYSLGITKDSTAKERAAALAKFCDQAIAAAPEGENVGFFIPPNQNNANAQELKAALNVAIEKAKLTTPTREFKICDTREELKDFKENKQKSNKLNLQ